MVGNQTGNILSGIDRGTPFEQSMGEATAPIILQRTQQRIGNERASNNSLDLATGTGYAGKLNVAATIVNRDVGLLFGIVGVVDGIVGKNRIGGGDGSIDIK